MPDTPIDNLKIEIEKVSAADSLKSLTSALRSLEKVGQGTGFGKLYTSLKKLNTLEFSKLSKTLGELQKQMSGVASPFVKLSKIETPKAIKAGKSAAVMVNDLEDPLLRQTALVGVLKKQIKHAGLAYAEVVSEMGKDSAPAISLLKRQITLTNRLVKEEEKLLNLQLNESPLVSPLESVLVPPTKMEAGEVTQHTDFQGVPIVNLAGAAAEAAADFSKALEGITDPIRRTEVQLEILEKQIENTKNEFTAAAEKLGLTNKKTLALQSTITTLTARHEKLNEALEKLRAEKAAAKMGELGKEIKKSTGRLADFARSVIRIAKYRFIRQMLKAVVDAFRTGMQNLVQYSDEADQSISNIVNSTNQLKNTLGVTFVNIISAVEPIILRLVDGLNAVANTINMVTAAASGKDTFTKATKSADSYADSLERVNGQLFSFDRFESLTGDKQVGDMFEMEEVSIDTNLSGLEQLGDVFKELERLAGSLMGLLKDVLPTITSITDALSPAFAGAVKSIVTVISPLTQLVGWVVKLLDKINLLTPALAGVGIMALAIKTEKAVTSAESFNQALLYQHGQAAITAIKLRDLKAATEGKSSADVIAAEKAYLHEKALLRQMQITKGLNIAMSSLQAVMGVGGLMSTIDSLIKDWHEMSAAQRVSQVSTAALTAAMFALAIAKIAAQSGLAAAVTVPIALAAIGAGIWSAVASAKQATIGRNFMGGIPERDLAMGGSVFSLNEYGKPELMYENSRRQVEISNQESLEKSFYAALTAWGSEQTRAEGSGDIVLNINGREFARRTYKEYESERLRRAR